MTPEEVHEIMRAFRNSLKTTEAGEDLIVGAATIKKKSASTAERLLRQEANWQREVAAAAQHVAECGDGKWNQEVR